MASVSLKCELVTQKHCLAWKWTKVANWMLEDGVEVAEMASGRDFAVYLTSSGQLLHCGEMPRRVSYEKFRLRQGRRRSRAHTIGTELKRMAAHERQVYKGHSCDSRCCPVELPMSTKARVLQVACGVTHCVALGEVSVVDGINRRLFAWGVGEYGQLGLGECQAASKMTPIAVSSELDPFLQTTDKDHPVVLRCGAFSTYLLRQGTSSLWHWGLLSSAADSRYVRQGVPVKFPLLDEKTRLVDVAAGVEHVVFLTEFGYVLTWGYGNSGQLGLGPSITSNVDNQPTPVDFFRQEDNYRIASISCGVHIEGTEAEIQERVDARWYKLLSKRIRVYTDDTVVLLVESATNDTNPAIQVEYGDNHWEFELTRLDVVGSGNKSRAKTLGVVQLRFSSPGQYFIYETKTHEDVRSYRTPLLVVNCCIARQERQRIITENHDLVWSRYQATLSSAQQPVQFTIFLSSILQHSTLRNSVVCSPWIATYDEVCCESSYDFDREFDAQYVLMNHPARPFILWDEFWTTTSTLDSLQQRIKGADSLRLSSILPDWAELLSSKVSFRIASWLGKPNARSTKSLEELPIDYEEVRSKDATGVSVKQIPFDFLGSVSLIHQPAVRDALVPANPNIIGVHDSIVSWKRMNGDLFYTVQSNDLLVQRYGHESHDFPETAQSGRITRLMSQLSDFLWQAAEGKKLEDLFFLLTSPTCQRLKISKDHNPSIHGVIHLHELLFHVTALGFDGVVAMPKQEWFALFRAVQELSPPHSAGITFSTFRTFLIDPVHQFFWKQYVHQIREQADSNRAMITQALSDGFKINDKVTSESSNNSRDDEALIIPWSDFVESLKSFHGILGLKLLSPSDCCRLLYRFDACGNGQVSIQTYQNTILHTLDEIDAATQAYDFTTVQRTRTPKGKQQLKVAIANGHRRPNVESFTSSEAVHKLFAARAKTSTNFRLRASSNDTCQSSCTITSRATDAAAKLRASANTHLARIRNLPISHLLREGIHFRPPRETLYRCEDETQAQTMGAEESY
ncbi:hypothetical protein JG688_00000343 [Phytophthora aleatoria]|uniref:Regulator of chromosome condensation (RCC1)-like protein n=1 Tax=Phytophthora aleatoria TaxID=2496075 RepID=A0A8J5IX46_9STRA|nr:hypothetical protein JG688_00000343 [Phytophthora aleatoria]